MKNRHFLLLACCFYLACTPTITNKTATKIKAITEITPLSQGTSLKEEEVIMDDNLEYYLKRTAGVSIIGFWANAVVYVRGIAKPRFVINGNGAGCNLQFVADRIRQKRQKIKSIKTLHYSQGVATLYGRRPDIAKIFIETE